MLSAKLKEAAGNSADATLYVDDVFSTYLYTGNGSTQTITNGIDLAGKGGLVWFKPRNTGNNHNFIDSASGISKFLISNDINAQQTATPPYGVSSFNSDGFSLGNPWTSSTNTLSTTYASWTFRKAAKFFDVVTYTGTGSARTIAHSLGVAPGMIIVKRTDAIGAWNVYHQDLTYAKGTGGYLTTIPGENFLELNNTTLVNNNIGWWNNTDATSSNFTVGTVDSVNASGGTYVAYIFASDAGGFGASGTESIIKCGYYVGDGTTNYSKTINTGFEPQFVLVKKTSQTSDVTGWGIADTMRGLNTGNTNWLLANSTAAESILGGEAIRLNSTGFSVGTSVWNRSGSGYIYMAIRRPNKPPTTGTQVFAPVIGNSSSSFPYWVNYTSFTVDAQLMASKSSIENKYECSRLQGTGKILYTNTTAAEVSNDYPAWDRQTGVGDNTGGSNFSAYITWNFKRAPGFFDVVCYTGNGVLGQTYNHNLTVSPELIIVKARNSVRYWAVYPNTLSSGLYLNLTGSFSDYGSRFTSISSTTFGVQNDETTNFSGYTYVTYLFATLAGISKVGSYTGNGTGQAIACGFGSGGARFVLIKRTDASGSWYTFDSARGLTSGSSPYLLLNSTAAEVTGNNGVYASSGGFTLDTTAITTTNIATATYIFLAVA